MKATSTNRRTSITVVLLGLCIFFPFSPLSAAEEKAGDPYYTEKPLFHPAPKSTSSKPFVIKNFGPVGIGIDLVGTNGGFKMVINNVEKGSPAAAAKQLKSKQIIKSINGRIMKDRDPRMILGDIITEAEAEDGKIVLDIEGVGEIGVQIPVMGSYSRTWPLNCEKSDMIVSKLADFLAGMDKPTSGAPLFLLSTGEDKYLDVVRKWMSEKKTLGTYQWHIGYHGIGVCEYYLRTGDRQVLPMIGEAAEQLRKTMYNGGWSGRGNPAQFTYSTGTGQMNAAGIHCMSFLMLAKICGVEVDEYMFKRATTNFFRYAGKGNVPYGDGWPENGFRDNGKTGGLAVTMAIAARLDPKGEESIYAKARDNSAMKSFYGTNWFHSAHTGGGIGEIWHNTAMSLMHERRPVQHRSFIDTRRWVMELSRRHNGSIGIAGLVDRYDVAAGEGGIDWGTYFALTYTIPRKALQLAGAPKTEWCKTESLPVRPWGNAADDMFQSSEPAAHPSISKKDLMDEKVGTDASVAVFDRLYREGEVSDETILRYLHHPEYAFRMSAAGRVAAQGRDHLVLPLLKASDPRLRQAGLQTLSGKTSKDRISGTAEMFEIAGGMIADPDESWWVKVSAANALASANPQMIARFIDPLMAMMESEYWYLSAAACRPLSILATTPEYHRSVQPALLKTIFEAEAGAGVSVIYGYLKQMGRASKEVKAFAAQWMMDAYPEVPSEFYEPSNGIRINGKARHIKKTLGYAMGKLPDSQNYIKTQPKMTLAARRSGKKEDMYVYSGKFESNPGLLGKWVALSKVNDTPEGLSQWVKDWKKNGSKPLKGKGFEIKNHGRFHDGSRGNHMGKEYFWTDDMMIGMFVSREARRMKAVTVDGIDFLLVEKGGFGSLDEEAERISPDPNWHCGYKVYIRQEHNGKRKK